MADAQNLTQTSQQTKQEDTVLTQLRRIRGQVDGVIKMYEDERGCVDVVRQMVAVRNSLGRVVRDILSGAATRCSKQDKIEELDDLLKEVFRN